MTHRIANEGDKIEFLRNGLEIVGEVIKSTENSVIVAISNSDAIRINVETPRTVVSHKKYRILVHRNGF